MTIKCGFFDCNNPAKKGKNMCQNCDKREEYKVCSACRQPEPKKGEFLVNHENFFLNKFFYPFAKKMRDKAPAQFQSEIDQLLPNLKLSAAEEKLLGKAQKAVLDFVTEKGGKQDNSQWIKFCSVCNSEFEEGKEKEFVNQNPEFRNLMNRLGEDQKNLQKISKKIEQAIGKEKWEKIGEEVQDELEEEFSDTIKQLKQNFGNDNRQPNSNQNNDNSVKITQLQQEINGLKQEIQDLKNSRNPTLPNPNTLQQKENKLREKEKELGKLTRDNNSPSNNQSSKGGDSNLLLYFGLGAVGIVIILLAALLISKKKKKH